MKPLHYKINNTSQCKASTRKEISIKIRIFGIDYDICFLLQYEIIMLFLNSIVLWRYLAVLYFLVHKVVQKYDINCFDNLSSKIAHIYSKPNFYVTFGNISLRRSMTKLIFCQYHVKTSNWFARQINWTAMIQVSLKGIFEQVIFRILFHSSILGLHSFFEALSVTDDI